MLEDVAVMAEIGTKVLFIAGFGPIDRDVASSRALYGDTLGIPFKEEPGGYLYTGSLEGAKHFALWPLSQAAQSCFGSDSWPDNVPIPQAWLEFEVEDVEKATADLESRHYRMLIRNKTEPWGQIVSRFLSPESLLVSFAEYACASEAKLVRKPESVSFDQAAAVPIAGLTALQGLRDKGHLKAGQKVLINGAAGGIGTFAVQIAKSFGANVTGVCSTKNVELVRSLGADRVIDYTRDDFTQDSERYDLLLDNVGNRTLSAMSRVLSPSGKCAMAGAPKQLWAVFARLLKAFVRPKFKFFVAKINRDDLTTLCGLIEAGKLTPVIDRRYPLAETAGAIAYVEEGHARAKVVLTF